jgi:hypothetical protein
MRKESPRHLAKPPAPRRGPSRRSFGAGITVVVLVAGTIFGMNVARDHHRVQTTGEPEPAPAVVPTMPPATGPPGPDNLVPDPGFETGLAGWRAVGGAVLSRVRDGRDGGWAARVSPGGGGDGTPGLSLPDAVRSKPGQLYHANGWVRSGSPGAVLTIALYELVDGKVARENILGMRLPDTAWHQFGTLHRTAVPGSALSLVIAARQLPRGAWFEVDQVFLHQL